MHSADPHSHDLLYMYVGLQYRAERTSRGVIQVIYAVSDCDLPHQPVQKLEGVQYVRTYLFDNHKQYLNHTELTSDPLRLFLFNLGIEKEPPPQLFDDSLGKQTNEVQVDLSIPFDDSHLYKLEFG